MWTIAKVKNSFANLSNVKFHTYAILKNGKIIGKLKFDHSLTNSTGVPAWQGILYVPKEISNITHHEDIPVVLQYHDTNRDNVLNWFKTNDFNIDNCITN